MPDGTPAARAGLRPYDVITALGSKSGTAYGSASEAVKDAWLAANSDRVMFGDGSVGGFTDHSADLALVTAGMKLTKEIVSKAKAKAEVATPIIRPVTVGEDSENFVMGVQWHPEFHPSRQTQVLDCAPLLEVFMEAAERSRDRRVTVE